MASDRESAKVFVAKIPSETPEEQIYAAFERYGPIAEMKMLVRNDGSFRGCAFIKYASDRSARKCLILDGKTVFSHETLVVRAAEDKRSYQKKKDTNLMYFQSQARLQDQFQRRNSLAQSGISSSQSSTIDSDNKMTCDGMKIPVESRPIYGAAITRPRPTCLVFPGSSDTDRRATYGPSAQPQSSPKLHLPAHCNRGLIPYTNIQNGSGLGGTVGGGTHFVGGAIISADLQISESVPNMMNKSSSLCMGAHPMLTGMHTETTMGTPDGHTTTPGTPYVHSATTGTPDGHAAGMQPKDYHIHQARQQQQQNFQTQYERQQQTQELLFGDTDEGDNSNETHNHQHRHLNTNQHIHTHQHEHQHQHQHQHQYVFSSHHANINNTNINITINGMHGAHSLNGHNSPLLPPSRFNGAPPRNDNDVCVIGRARVDPTVGRALNPRSRKDLTAHGHGFVGNHTVLPSSHTTQLLGEEWSYNNPYCVAEADIEPIKCMSGNFPTRFGFIHFQQPPMACEAASEIMDEKRLKPCMSF